MTATILEFPARPRATPKLEILRLHRFDCVPCNGSVTPPPMSAASALAFVVGQGWQTILGGSRPNVCTACAKGYKWGEPE